MGFYGLLLCPNFSFGFRQCLIFGNWWHLNVGTAYILTWGFKNSQLYKANFFIKEVTRQGSLHDLSYHNDSNFFRMRLTFSFQEQIHCNKDYSFIHKIIFNEHLSIHSISVCLSSFYKTQMRFMWLHFKKYNFYIYLQITATLFKIVFIDIHII